MTDENTPEVGWLHYRLAVSVCSAFVMGIMLLLGPLILSVGGVGAEPLVLYAFVFSKWGAVILLATSVLGFIVGGERMANFFSIIWGTHPFWSELEDWLQEHDTVAVFLGWGAVIFIVGFFWYSFR